MPFEGQSMETGSMQFGGQLPGTRMLRQSGCSNEGLSACHAVLPATGISGHFQGSVQAG
jgi:hypothetical protein